MKKNVATLKQHEAPSHRAFYHAVSKQRWTVFQKRVLLFWGQKDAFSTRCNYAKRYYLPILKRLFKKQDDDISILEIGSGPVCVAQYLEKGHQTYIDPLLDDYRRLFPGAMPETASYITEMAEKVNIPDESFDAVLCFNTLSDVHNPELVLNKVSHILKQDGLFVVSIDLWPSLLARAHFHLSRLAPGLPRVNRLYSYTYKGFRNTLCRHFKIVSEQRVGSALHWLSMRQEFVFICKQQPNEKKGQN